MNSSPSAALVTVQKLSTSSPSRFLNAIHVRGNSLILPLGVHCPDRAVAGGQRPRDILSRGKDAKELFVASL